MPEALNTISGDVDVKLDVSTVRKERASSFAHRTELCTTSPRLTQSQVYSKKPREQPSSRPNPIPEDELATFHIGNELRLESTRTSAQSSRSNRSKRSTRGHKNSVIHPPNEVGDNLSNRSIGTNFDRSSSRNTSISSRLTVTREQYWCFSKWTAGEKKLGVAVAVLITLIIILAIIIGVLATQEDSAEA